MATTPSTDFDISHLTMGEVTQLEELSGLSITQMGDKGVPMGRFMTALAFLAKRRTDPKYTFEKAQTLTLTELGDILGSDADPKA